MKLAFLSGQTLNVFMIDVEETILLVNFPLLVGLNPNVDSLGDFFPRSIPTSQFPLKSRLGELLLLLVKSGTFLIIRSVKKTTLG